MDINSEMQKNILPVDTELRGEILLVRLNRPEKRNAMNDATVLQLEEIFSNIPPDVKCAVISGAGKHFSAGLDLSELTERDAVQGVLHSRMWHRALDKIQFGNVPVVAVLHGACVGLSYTCSGGIGLLCVA
jgi:(methylthio)acryloyl-CoA hydratase